MYTLATLGLGNFKCYRGSHELDFNGKPVVGVVGRYVGIDGRSNWSGKSTIGAAIKYLLYGRVESTLAEKVVSWGADVASVWGTLVDLASGDEVNIRRSVTTKGESSLEVNGEEGVERGDDILKGILGLSYDDWLLSAFFEQKDVQRFTELRPGQKRDEVQKWIERSCWPVLYKLAKDRLRDVTSQIDEAKRISNQTSEDISAIEAEEFRIAGEIAKEREVQKQLSESVSEWSSFQERLHEARSRLSGYFVSWSKVVRQNDYVLYVEQLIDKEEDLSVLLATLANISEQLQLSRDIQSEKKRRRDELKSGATGEFSGACPIDGNECPRASELQEGSTCAVLLPAAEMEYQIATGDVNRILSSKNGVERDVQRLQREIATIRAKAEPRDIGLFPDTDEWNSCYETYLTHVKDNEASSDIGDRYDESSRRIGELERYAGTLSQRKVVANRIKKEVAESKETVRELQKTSNALTFLVYAFSKEGISAAQVETALEQIVTMADLHISRLGTGLGLRFNYERELKKKSDICYKCGTIFPPRVRNCPTCEEHRPFKRASDLSIDVKVDGHWEELELQSGGCKDLVAIMLRLAVSKMLRQRGRLTVPVGWIDEVLGSLDPVNRVALANEFISGGDLGLNQRIVVTHNEEIQSMFPHVIQVEHEGSWSTLGWL